MLVRKWQQLINRFSNRTIVLCYHRIANEEVDPWGLNVSVENFEQQLKLFNKKYDVVSVEQLVGKRASSQKKSGAVCITFDDGYTDNFFNAKKLLEKHHSSACFFISSGYIGKPQLFWWDELAQIFLTTPVLPETLDLTIGDRYLTIDNTDGRLLTADQSRKLQRWQAKNAPIDKRSDLFLCLWDQIRQLRREDIESVIGQLRCWSGYNPATADADVLPMSREQLLELAQNPLFTIGLHTVSHVALDNHPWEIQDAEIGENKKDLEAILTKEVNIISFPYGRYNNTTLKVVKKHNLKASFTSEKKAVSLKTNYDCFGRFAVGNWTGAEMEQKLDRWFKER